VLTFGVLVRKQPSKLRPNVFFKKFRTNDQNFSATTILTSRNTVPKNPGSSYEAYTSELIK